MLELKIGGITPLTYDHNDPIGSINKIIEQLGSQPEHPILIASSLGGWYAEQIARRFPVDLILYNPSLNPRDSLEKYGVDSRVRAQYHAIDQTNMAQCMRFAVVSTDDDVVAPDNALNIYSGRATVHQTTGGHRMTEQNCDMVVDCYNYLSNLYID